MKFKKAILLLAVMLLLFVFSSSAFAASGTYGPVSSSPSRTSIYYPNTWSSLVYWDLRNVGIPSNAVVTGVRLGWDVSEYGYYGMHVALYKQDGNGYFIPYNNLWNDSFDGAVAAQKWSSRFYVEQWNKQGRPLYVTPELTVYYDY